jgi:hypothetical protein
MGPEDPQDHSPGVRRSTRSTLRASGRASCERPGVRVVRFDQIDMPAFMPFCPSHLWITLSTSRHHSTPACPAQL